MDYNSSHLLHEGKLSDGNPALGIPASLDKAEHMNAITDELLNIILGGGLTPDKDILNQAQLSIVAQIQTAINNVISAAPGVLDTLDELAAALGDDPNFATTITALIAAKVSTADVINVLTSTAIDKPLSAAQGKVLNDAISLRVLTSAIVNNLTSTATNVPLSAAQGKVLKDELNTFTGAVVPFSMSSPPTGWLKCNGAEISRTSYANLFAAIGTTFGVGNGSTTFNIPDLRGEFIRGWDDGRGVDPSRNIGSWQKGTLVVSDPDMTSPYVAAPIGTPSAGTAAQMLVAMGADPVGSSDYTGSQTARVSSTASIENGASGFMQGSMRPRNVALLFCIKY